MRAVYISEFGGAENLEIRDVSDPPAPTGSKVLVRVRAAGVNRADILQRRGLYPPPASYSPNIPGLEFAGEVEAAGELVNHFKSGDRVFGITAGEAQAEFLLTDEKLLALIPESLTFTGAAAVPEVFITAHDALITQAGLREGEWVLIHAVGSGVGLAALQLARAFGAKVIGTSRTQEKLDRCAEFGLDHAILTSSPEFSEQVTAITDGAGVNVILDLVGAPYFGENLKSLAVKGRLLLVGLTGGAMTDFDLRVALSKRLTITGTALRSRSLEEKAAATQNFVDEVIPHLKCGALRPVLDHIFDIEDVRSAHELLESNKTFGKVVLSL